MSNTLTFMCEKNSAGNASLTPCIDGVNLTDLVKRFETESGYDDPAGGYAGIIPALLRLGRLPSYFLGQEEPIESEQHGEIYALFCECGDGGCWPLITHVQVSGDYVTWDRFSQPHRPNRDYTNFGPFRFKRQSYDLAVAKASAFADASMAASPASPRRLPLHPP